MVFMNPRGEQNTYLHVSPYVEAEGSPSMHVACTSGSCSTTGACMRAEVCTRRGCCWQVQAGHTGRVCVCKEASGCTVVLNNCVKSPGSLYPFDLSTASV